MGSEPDKAAAPGSTRTHFEWGWDEADGSVFKRFNRTSGFEVWLVGFELADDLTLMSGNMIEEPGGHMRRCQVATLAFQVPVTRREEATVIVEDAKQRFPAFPDPALLERLWGLAHPSWDEPPRDAFDWITEQHAGRKGHGDGS